MDCSANLRTCSPLRWPGGSRNTHQITGDDTIKDLNFQLKQICKQCREGSYATQRNRERILTLIANELHALGYRQMQARSLILKHIEWPSARNWGMSERK